MVLPLLPSQWWLSPSSPSWSGDGGRCRLTTGKARFACCVALALLPCPRTRMSFCYVVDQRSRTTSGSMILARLWSRANPLGPEAASLGFRLRTYVGVCHISKRHTSKITSCNDDGK